MILQYIYISILYTLYIILYIYIYIYVFPFLYIQYPHEFSHGFSPLTFFPSIQWHRPWQLWWSSLDPSSWASNPHGSTPKLIHLKLADIYIYIFMYVCMYVCNYFWIYYTKLADPFHIYMYIYIYISWWIYMFFNGSTKFVFTEFKSWPI